MNRGMVNRVVFVFAALVALSVVACTLEITWAGAGHTAKADPWSWGHQPSHRYLRCFYGGEDCTNVPMW